MAINPDLLEELKLDDISPDLRHMEKTNQLLLMVIQELKKSHPSQRCVVDLQWHTALPNVLGTADDYVQVRFLAQGKPVLADYIVIAANCDTTVHAGINETLRHNAANTFFNGVPITGATRLQLLTQTEFVELRISPGGGAALNIPVNNSTDIPVAGQIQIYAWTIPAMSDF